MGFGGFMIGLVGYGFGLACLLGAAAAARDFARSKRSFTGVSPDGCTAEQNAGLVISGLFFSFLAFVVTWLVLSIKF